MNLRNLARKPSSWIVAGFLTGALAMASVMDEGLMPAAFADPETNPGKTVGGVRATDMAALHSLNDSFAGIVEYVAPSVVHITSESGPKPDVFGRPMAPGGQGSGVILRPDGYIITNDHVVGGFEKVTVVLHDGRQFEGKVIRAADSDIAVVKIEATDLPTAQFGDSNRVKPGQFAIAVGSPFGLENSVTIGHISGLGRQSSIPDSRLGTFRNYPDLLQTDAAINMGNSGGPLMNIDGEIIGINTAIFSETGGNVGIGFAIPSNQARLIAELLIDKGKIVRGFMGVLPENLKPYQKKERGVSGGALLSKVESDSPAASAGLREKDIVVRIGSYPITSQLDLRNAMLRYEPGQTVEVEYLRDSERKVAQVKLAEPKVETATIPKPESPHGGKMPFDFDEFKGFDKDLRKFFEGPDGEEEQDVPPVREGSARLGVNVDSVENARKQFELPQNATGAVVMAVDPGSVAEKLGMQPGDVIQQVGQTKVESPEDLVKAMQGVKWGQRRTIKVSRYRDNSVATQTRDVLFR